MELLKDGPVDTLRKGLGSLKHDVIPEHPLAAALQADAAQRQELRSRTLTQLYGSALPLREQLDAQILRRVGAARVGAVGAACPPARLGLATMDGSIDTFDFGDYLGLPANAEAPRVTTDLHAAMEHRLGLAPSTALPAADARLGR
jgi:proteasome maturation protein